MILDLLRNCFIPATLAMATTITIVACCLLCFNIPSDDKLKNYRLARRLLAGAYITLVFFVVLRLFYKDGIEGETMVTTSTLVVSFYQAFLFTYALITLIDYRFMTRRRLTMQTLYLTIAAIFIFSGEFLPEQFFYPILYTGSAIYALFLIYYVVLFEKEYKKHIYRMDNFFSDDEKKRLYWIRSAFYLSLGIGIFAFLVVFGNQTQYNIFIITCTMFYGYIGVKYINYTNTFHYISDAISSDMEQDTSLISINNQLDSKIQQWISDKKYIQSHITLDNLTTDLATNRTYLSRYINSTMGYNFKTWISHLRIEEAKRLLVEEPDLPAVDIAEQVGISDKSSFFRQFSNLEQLTPREYREKQIGSK